MDTIAHLRLRHNDEHREDAIEHVLWTTGPLTPHDMQLEPPDFISYELSCLAPDPATGTPYPLTGNLESVWSGPTWIDFLMYDHRRKAKTGVFDRAEDASRHLHTLWDDPLKTMSRARNEEIQGAVQRLGVLQELRESGNWGPDIVFKAFHDLDLALFGGALRGMCKIRWITSAQFKVLHPLVSGVLGCSEAHYIRHGRVAIPGEDDAVNECKCWSVSILLNRTAHFLRPMLDGKSRWTRMWATLVHEMVHAYLRLSLKPTERERSHKVNFQICLRAVNRRLKELNLRIRGTFFGPWEVDKAGNPFWEDIEDEDGGEVEGVEAAAEQKTVQ